MTAADRHLDSSAVVDGARADFQDLLFLSRLLIATSLVLIFAPVLLVWNHDLLKGVSHLPVWGFAYCLAVGATFFGGLLVGSAAERSRQRFLYLDLQISSKSMFLMLRPFRNEALTQAPERTKISGEGRFRYRRSFLPRLAAAFECFGPVVAIGDNKGSSDDSEWPLLFLQLDEARWWDGVQLAAAAARGIIVIPSPSPGVLQEIRFLQQRSLFSKTIVLMPPYLHSGGGLSALPEYAPSGIDWIWSAMQRVLVQERLHLPDYDPGGMLFIPQDDLSIKKSVPLHGTIYRMKSAVAALVPHLVGDCLPTSDVARQLQPLVVVARPR